MSWTRIHSSLALLRNFRVFAKLSHPAKVSHGVRKLFKRFIKDITLMVIDDPPRVYPL